MFSTICWTLLNTIRNDYGFHETINQFQFFHQKVNSYYLINKLTSNRNIKFCKLKETYKSFGSVPPFFFFFRLENRNVDLDFFHPFIVQSSLFCLYISLLKCNILICASDVLLVSALLQSLLNTSWPWGQQVTVPGQYVLVSNTGLREWAFFHLPLRNICWRNFLTVALV